MTTPVDQASDTHQHHWIIAEASGPVSDGVCKRCGVRREFHNSFPEPDYVEGRATGSGRWWSGSSKR